MDLVETGPGLSVLLAPSSKFSTVPPVFFQRQGPVHNPKQLSTQAKRHQEQELAEIAVTRTGPWRLSDGEIPLLG
jgi:hypothetical protein